MEQFISSCPEDLAIHLKQTTYEKGEDLCNAASLFLHARGRKLAKSKKASTRKQEYADASNNNNSGQGGAKKEGACYICNDK